MQPEAVNRDQTCYRKVNSNAAFCALMRPVCFNNKMLVLMFATEQTDALGRVAGTILKPQASPSTPIQPSAAGSVRQPGKCDSP